MTESPSITKREAVKTLRVTPKRHTALGHLALDHNASIIEIADRVIDAGLRAMGVDQSGKSPSAN